MLWLFSITLFVSAALLFGVQPMFGRMVLPLLGGSPSVWNTVMVFYQVALLAGYGYAHALGRRRSSWWGVHLLLMGAVLFMLPLRIAPGRLPPAGGHPVAWLLCTMATTIGLPFLLLSTTGPLLQRWFTHTGHAQARDPYFLYGASNVGSMLGLLAYPFVVEPRWTLAEQSRLWAIGYGILVVLLALCALATRKGAPIVAAPTRPPVPGVAPAAAPAPLEERIDWRRRLQWVALSFAPSSLMLAVTTHLSMDLVAIPLLWIIPLSIYLLTFIVAFARRPPVPARWAPRIMVYAVLGVVIVLVSHAAEPLGLVIGLHFAALFAAGLSCHGTLAGDRPGVSRLTEFYVWVAVGGALGGVFNALIAPVIFDSVAEYPIALTLACLLMPRWLPTPAPPAATPGTAASGAARGVGAGDGPGRDLVASLAFTAVVAAIVLGPPRLGHNWRRVEFELVLVLLCFPLFAFRRRPLRFGLALGGLLMLSSLVGSSEQRTLYARRSFFGIHRVQEVRTSRGLMHQLVHGTTVHGMQWVEPDRCDEPLSYYHREGPAGEIFATLGRFPRATRIAVVGMGTGALTAYAEPGQEWTYFEIDPVVVGVASNPRWFCYLGRSSVRPRVVLGDARLSLEADTTRYDLLVLDAYTSDAIPVHLLTREAFDLYLHRLTPHGVLVVHLSNRYFDLEPVVDRIAREIGLARRIHSDGNLSPADLARGRVASHWAVLARDPVALAPLIADARWKELRSSAGGGLWTDGYSSLVSVLR